MNHCASHPAPTPPNDRVALFFDIDGTLAPLAATPDAARIPSDMLALLHTLRQQTGGAVAFISGRNLADIDRMSAGDFPAAGQHGLEWRDADGTVQREAHDGEVIAHIAQELRVLARQYPGLLVEEKGLSVALHYRLAPQLQGLVEEALQRIAAAHRDVICLQRGKMVGELRLARGSKGEAIRRLLATPTFAGKTPIFAGDDVTDEDGFCAVNALGGISIKIGRGATQARWRLDSVGALGAWLQQLSHAAHSTPTVSEAQL